MGASQTVLPFRLAAARRTSGERRQVLAAVWCWRFERAAVRRLRQTTRVKTAFVLMPRYVAAAL